MDKKKMSRDQLKEEIIRLRAEYHARPSDHVYKKMKELRLELALRPDDDLGTDEAE